MDAIPEPTIAKPATLADWQAQRQQVRERLWSLLGDLPPLFTPQATLIERTNRPECIVEKFSFDNGAGAQVYGLLLIPHQLTMPAPAILYHHGHGGKYETGKEKMFQGFIPNVMAGATLAAAGYVVMAIDAYCFGDRQTQGPAGEAETGRDTEHSLFKHFLWRGSTLWGMMVRDDLLALNYLLTRPEIDPDRVGVTGMSLGGSRTTWMCALDERPRALVPVAQMTRYRDFAESGRYSLHSVYYYVPNALQSGLDMEHLVALAAPRTQAILIGDSDPLSPFSGVEKVLDYARHVYRLYGAEDRLTALVERGIAHEYTPAMFEAMQATMSRALRGE